MTVNIRKALSENRWIATVVVFFSLVGPGIITGSVDNDAGGITTYSVAGAMYGYKLLWVLIPSFFVLVVVQEMNARMGMVTGKGLADLIRENFGVKVTALIFVFLLVADIGNTATEFAGIAGSMNVFGISKYLSVPIAAIGIWLFVTRGSYKSAEKIFLLMSFFLLSYVISTVMSKPDWASIGSSFVHPDLEWNPGYFTMVLGIIGTTIAPWMQFYMQSAVIEKGLKIDTYRYTLADVILGSVITVVVAFFIIVACAASLHVSGVHITEAKDAAMALKPLAGAIASEVFALGLLVASLFSAIILPLATAFYICEAFGFEAGISRKIHEAPQFYGLLFFIIVISVLIILVPGAPLIEITIWSQVLNAILLPIVLVSMFVIVNKVKVMGEHRNNPVQNIFGVVTVVVLVGLSMMLFVSPLISLIRGK